jgi:CheY-like chemotaxis protein
MPLVDGPASTKLIRQFESTASPPLSSQAQSRGRIPIIALSASLEEKNRNEYLQVGFDGWILKPMEIRRLNAFMGGIWDATVRKAYTYEDGMWESGGWFKVI